MLAEERKIVLGSVRMEGKSSMSAVWDVTHGHTGRTVRGNEAYALADEWSRLETRETLLAHSACEEFKALLPSAPRLMDSSLVFFRGRGISGAPPISNQMGPPPQECVPAGGRYNYPGQHVLYLCDCEDGVLRELDAWYVNGLPYVQRYRLPLSDLNIADFSKIPADHFVAAVFSKAEECSVEGRGPKGYVLSQVVAELVNVHFDGMRVPGVRGKPGNWYSNVVVFNPHPDWPKWLDPDSSPYPIPMASPG